MKSITRIIGLSLVASSMAGATQLTFNITGQTNGTTVPAGYGNRVNQTTIGNFSYGAGGDFTPNVSIAYPGTAPIFWQTGYSDLTNVIYSASSSIVLSADPGYCVRLDSLDIGNFSGATTLGELRVEDGAGAVLFSQKNISLPANSSPHVSITFPVNLVAAQIRLRFFGASSSVGYDNIQFGQVQTPTHTGGVVLTFDGHPGGSMNQSYGDRITSLTNGTFVYGWGGSFTPNVVVDYVGIAGNTVQWWGSGYSDLQNVIWSAAAAYSVNLTADPGYQVVLRGFDLGNFYGASVLSSLRVEDGSGNILFSRPNLQVPVSTVPHLDYVFPTGLRASQLKVIVDVGFINSGLYALDNIYFSQELTAELSISIPSPASNQVNLSWPNVVGGLTLEKNDTSPSAPWTTVSSPAPTLNAGTWSVTLPNSLARSFYRVRQP